MDDLDGLGDKELIQSALRGDFELITGYGEEHPGHWAGAWFDNEPAVRIVAAFTGDVAVHDAALRPRLRHPDRLVVESRQHSLSGLRRVRQEIERTAGQRATQTGRPILTSIGEGKGVICVALRADQENLASELAARYGSAVELRVGAFCFPDRRRGHPRPPVRPGLEEWTFEGLEMSVEAGQRVLQAGDYGHARLVLRNSSSERIGPLAARGTGAVRALRRLLRHHPPRDGSAPQAWADHHDPRTRYVRLRAGRLKLIRYPKAAHALRRRSVQEAPGARSSRRIDLSLARPWSPVRWRIRA